MAFVRVAANLIESRMRAFSLFASPCSVSIIRSAKVGARLSEHSVVRPGSGGCGA